MEIDKNKLGRTHKLKKSKRPNRFKKFFGHNKTKKLSLSLMALNFGILIGITVYFFIHHLESSAELERQEKYIEELRLSVSEIQSDVKQIEDAQLNAKPNNEAAKILLPVLQKINRHNERSLELASNKSEISNRFDSSLLLRVFANGGILILSLLGFLLSLAAFAWHIFFKEMKEKVEDQIHDSIQEVMDPNLRILYRELKLQDARTLNSRGYLSYVAYTSGDKKDSAAIANLKQAIHVTSIAYYSLELLQEEDKDTPVDADMLSDDQIKKYNELMVDIKKAYLWAKCNLCYYMVEADESKLLANKKGFNSTIYYLSECFGKDNFDEVLKLLTFGLEDEVMGISKSKEVKIDWHELMDSILYCEFHFYKEQIASQPNYLNSYIEKVRYLLDSDLVRKSEDWRNSNLDDWNQRVDDLKRMSSVG